MPEEKRVSMRSPLRAQQPGILSSPADGVNRREVLCLTLKNTVSEVQGRCHIVPTSSNPFHGQNAIHHVAVIHSTITATLSSARKHRGSRFVANEHWQPDTKLNQPHTTLTVSATSDATSHSRKQVIRLAPRRRKITRGTRRPAEHFLERPLEVPVTERVQKGVHRRIQVP